MNQIACHECDLLLNLPVIEEGQRATCPRCNCQLTVNPRNGYEKALVFSITGLIFFVMANTFTFLSFEAKGKGQVMTLMQSCIDLYRYGEIFLSLFIFLFIILVPALLLFCFIWILTPLVFKGVFAQDSILLSRLIFHITPWSMAEVFLIGVLVSMVKIAALATVTFGISFWAYIGFVLCLTVARANLDMHHFWETLEKSLP